MEKDPHLRSTFPHGSGVLQEVESNREYKDKEGGQKAGSNMLMDIMPSVCTNLPLYNRR